MSFYHKYLKYKIKYTNLLKQMGGSWSCPVCTFENADVLPYCEMCNTPRPSIGMASAVAVPDRRIIDRTFYVYTTGLCEWGELDKAARSWIEFLRDSILRNIPEQFNNIIIEHYDPLNTDAGEKHIDIDIKRTIIDDFNGLVVANDNRLSNPRRRITSRFFSEELPIRNLQRNNPHILLDIAHIVAYLPPNALGQKQVQLNFGPKTIFNINSVYPGYCGSLQIDRGFSSQFIGRSNFLRVNADGTVITYIDRMYQRLYHREIDIKSYPQDFIRAIFISIRDRAFAEYKRIHPGEVGLIDKFEGIFTQDISQIIVMNIIDLIMGDRPLTKEQIIDTIYREIVQDIIR